MLQVHARTLEANGPQHDSAAAAMLHDGTIMMFGGRNSKGAAMSELVAIHAADCGHASAAGAAAGVSAMSCSTTPPMACTWRPVPHIGKAPPARWGHAAFAWGGQFVIAGGVAAAGGAPLKDVWRFNPATGAWGEVAQRGSSSGSGPERRGGATVNGYDRVAVVGCSLIAFGDPHDENRKPAEPIAAAAAGSIVAAAGKNHHNNIPQAAAPLLGKKRAAVAQSANTRPTALHALDLWSGRWAELPVKAAAPAGFDRLEGLTALPDGRLFAIGWRAPPRARQQQQQQRLPADKKPHSALGGGGGGGSSIAPSILRVATLDVASALRGHAVDWAELPACGDLPPARTGFALAVLSPPAAAAAAAAAQEGGGGALVVVHGGLPCGAAQGQQQQQQHCGGETFVLDLGSLRWAKVPVAAAAAAGAAAVAASMAPRINHCIIATVAAPAAALGPGGGVNLLAFGGTASLAGFASCKTIELLAIRAKDAQPPPPPPSRQPRPSASAAAAASPLGSAPLTSPLAAASGLTQTTRASAPTPPRSDAPSAAAGLLPGPAPAAAVAYSYSHFYLSDALSDVVLVCGEDEMPAHRIVLAASPRFLEMMERAATLTERDQHHHQQQNGNPWQPHSSEPAPPPPPPPPPARSPLLGRRWRVAADDLWPDVLRLLLAHLYGRLPAVPPADAAALFDAAARYGLPRLRAECLRALEANATVEGAATLALLAYDRGCDELMRAAVRFAAASKERLAQMIATPGYTHLAEASPQAARLFLSLCMEELLRREG